jgi:alpha-glucosidase (family GH31 glycosyl hydrolase)
VAPVFVPLGQESEYYLPEGKWTNFWNPDHVVQGPKWVKELVPINEIPVWVRQGSVLLLGLTGIGKPDYDYTQNLEVRVYEFDAAGHESVEVDVPSGRGTEVAAKIRVVKGQKIEVVSGSARIASQAFFG